jgi:hypothetical protein
MSRATIVPGHHPGNPDVDPAFTERYEPAVEVKRLVDRESSRSAFPVARRFETIYPGTPSSEEARAQMLRARDHDRTAVRGFVRLLGVITDHDDDPSNDVD